MVLRYAAVSPAEKARALRAAGLEAHALDVPGARISTGEFDAVAASLRPALDDPFFGLHFGCAFGSLMEGHFLHALMMSSADVRKALEIFFRYHALMSDRARPRLAEEGSEAVITISGFPAPPPAGRHLAESTAAMIVSVLRKITGNTVAVTAVRLRHEAPPGRDEYRKAFTAPVEFGADRDEVRFSREALARPLPFANAGAREALARYAEGLHEKLYARDDWTHRTLESIGEAVRTGGERSLNAVAAALGTGARTLQSRLADEGTGYRELRDRALSEAARSYMARRDMSLCDIALLLGFSEQSAFNRAFRKWTGLAPGEFRKRGGRQSE
jgi:AraC-like DNA-binding protein